MNPPVALLFLLIAVILVWLGYEWGRDNRDNSPEETDEEETEP